MNGESTLECTNNNEPTENFEMKVSFVDPYDQEMVIEPKFADYGSIHSAVDVPHNNPLHALLGPRTVLTSPPTEEPETSGTSKEMVQGDLYQRQPLLVNSTKGDHWGSPKVTTDNDYCIDDDDIQKSGASNGLIRIDMPPPSRDEPRFPQERWKTALAAIAMMFGFLATLVSLSIVHNQVPHDPPLPDVTLDNVPEINPALNVSEYIIMFNVTSCIVCMVFHKHRFIIIRRIFLLMSLLYMYRAITMFVTVLPLANPTYPCAPESNQTTVLQVVRRVVKLSAGFGLSINGDQIYCGDFIYSGHTVILVLSYLVISEYTPKKMWIVGIVYWILSLLGIVLLEMSHAHYTIDVIVAYYITTRLFWLYHTLANNAYLKQSTAHNLLSREWWFWFFQYFEGGVEGPVPIQFEWPLPWPRGLHSKNRDS
ncbi:hypothetical protein HHI36_019321 [Cryptolaemus montrouzieri]|uniref:Sphingomyelin synthase-like domain-containing protein n=1 Tax=Cryptolaemus montrouzieri TaxID=559131 RepID=A0ABD2P3E0_9CUCU